MCNWCYGWGQWRRTSCALRIATTLQTYRKIFKHQRLRPPCVACSYYENVRVVALKTANYGPKRYECVVKAWVAATKR